MSMLLLKFYAFVPVKSDDENKGDTHQRQLIDAMVIDSNGSASGPVLLPAGAEDLEVYADVVK